MQPQILCLAATDSSGIAGLNMDIRCASALNVHARTVVTATSSQNHHGLLDLNPVPDDSFISQLHSHDGAPIQAIKIGVPGHVRQLSLTADWLAQQQRPVVLDPVLTATLGGDFYDAQVLAGLRQTLLPQVTLITPNIPEAERLCDSRILTPDDMVTAAKQLLEFGIQAVLLKGGHMNGPFCCDYYVDQQRAFWLRTTRSNASNQRATGCLLSTAIASALALGYSLADAVVIGRMAISQGLRQSYGLTQQAGPVRIDHFPDHPQDLPELFDHYSEATVSPFPECGRDLGLYPVVDDVRWIERLLPLGIRTIQLRIKDQPLALVEPQIRQAIALCRNSDCRLFINDYWQLAIEHKAYGVHLGQEDLSDANLAQIRAAGLRLGISSHCHYEVARARSLKPSYIASGPIYPTTSKIMPWQPQGIEGLSYWRKLIPQPLVAIGGIQGDRIKAAHQAGADGVAMISAITASPSPETTVRHLMTLFS
ncbi:thiamine phosphate synthase [Gynuella sunshinyii]|uniref:Hydroxymethylpyrimidine/phosphomethylpyrimidine kinase n=1 Tax=Gynuella sunshinyii YC6258 TaxID=1445510 RepID=A0A0C5VWY7_9GAMM|nr:thiamine phosphate synthase [Gynuella sunshinyii]AJQ97813.1 hydroxymethylpyrimidine/phosphomethylpyrimidine kinase [Gynuella sunshinyii YC6258]